MIPEVAYIGLGSNLEDPVYQVKSAIDEISQIKDITLQHQSSLYQTKPLGPKQPDFVNAVISILTSLRPMELLDTLLNIEASRGRKREIKWGPRILDCDILLYGNQSIQIPALTVPHPEMTKRSFVLIPFFEIAPNFIFNDGKSLQTLVEQFNPDEYMKL
ncbi:2-amino-4-hydroxy-6-hydroxymethyldihydropteridine diphosphokinase [Candidatus Berkiella cookevillensis]|uniref:2-amino-4-hydroxy-6-hydroxymethyldihydropteridine pyrophosphokinase n=1 Tax=Candidatus Berkiella cookevillensis TaxID=437022 RepID=A0A0Q9YEW7_9GAMM|nr:2-amino-4-hydroxy-6-hydroxymethyldihydropteridine diphosphokinase [Candidatus Berkiella cookevillensis]MCS5709452.1 2-amino-4-hydroxy-6-hydroxymethyldihydropteridine diphosphokinase [Candidatus Berkiella cookevillensis]